MTLHHLLDRIVSTGGRWGVGTVHRILTRRTYIGEHEWGKAYKDGTPKTTAEVVTVPVPPIVDRETFDAVQQLLKKRAPMVTPGRTVSGPTLLTGICFCADCGGAMTMRTSGKAKHYRYYTCSTRARQGKTGCGGLTVPMGKLDTTVASHIEDRLLDPPRLTALLSEVLDRREDYIARRRTHITELRQRASEADAKLKRLYEAIENGVAHLSDPALKERVEELSAIRDQARSDAERADGAIERAGPELMEEKVKAFATAARKRLRKSDGSSRRDHLRAVAQRIEVVDKTEAWIMGSRTALLKTLTAARAQTAAGGVPTLELKWRTREDSNLWPPPSELVK